MRKNITAAMVLISIAFVPQLCHARCGDVSGDGLILSNDVLMVARTTIGTLTLTADQKIRADVVISGAPDGLILSNDLLLVARASLGVITTLKCNEAVCGNGVVETGEQCDDGNTVTETCAYGQTSCNICNSTCHTVAGATSYCGDGVINTGSGEQCDDGNKVSGDGCSAACRTEGGGITANVWLDIPAGDFSMGCPTGLANCLSPELPLHTVSMPDYKLQEYEVTNAQYKACVDASACAAPSNSSSATRASYYGNATYNNYPVIYVDWNRANAYCQWIGGRLPSEAEWEKAAHGAGTAAKTYPWGNGAANCSLANYDISGNATAACVGDTSEVGSFPTGVSVYGAMDMAGNVWEWVNDWYASNYYTTGGPTWSNPAGPASSPDGYRSLRGGAWDYPAWGLRNSTRYWTYPTIAYKTLGFRCAKN